MSLYDARLPSLRDELERDAREEAARIAEKLEAIAADKAEKAEKKGRITKKVKK